MKDDNGFTLIELITVIGLIAILMTLGAVALRHYWLTQALEGASDSLTSQLRQAQQRTDSESAPLIYGVRFEVGTPNWALVRYNPKQAGFADDVCEAGLTSYSFDGGVRITAADFDAPVNVDLTKCGHAGQEFALFYARGTATAGSVTLSSAATGRSRVVSVLPLTGRVRVAVP